MGPEKDFGGAPGERYNPSVTGMNFFLGTALMGGAMRIVQEIVGARRPLSAEQILRAGLDGAVRFVDQAAHLHETPGRRPAGEHIAFGFDALPSNTTGQRNFAFGSQAPRSPLRRQDWSPRDGVCSCRT